MCYNESMHKNIREGFTLIELSLSIAFIAVLSIAVTLIITNAITAYHRGLVLSQVNTVGMELIDDVRAAAQNAPAISVRSMCGTVYGSSGSNESDCKNDDGQRFVSVRATGNVRIGKSSSNVNVPIFGAFCTGSYSYIWNSGYFFDSSQYNTGSLKRATLTYTNSAGGTSTKSDFRLLKVQDEERAVCVSAVQGSYKANISNSFNITKNDNNNFGVVEEEPVDIMAKNGALALYDLSATVAGSSTINSMLYAASFILGTIQGGVNVMAAGNYCVAPEDETVANAGIESFDYCAINKFNFAAQSAGGGGE